MFKHQVSGLLLLLAATSSHALWSSPDGASAVAHDTVATSGAAWKYSYVVDNTDYCFVGCDITLLGKSISGYWLGDKEFALPYFSDAGIVDIANPLGWSHEISAENYFGLAGAGTLIWQAQTDGDRIATQASLGGFGYTASYSAGKGPFSVANEWDADRFIGDPAIPLSPLAIKAGIAAINTVPEPSSYALLSLGAICLVVAQKRRKRA